MTSHRNTSHHNAAHHISLTHLITPFITSDQNNESQHNTAQHIKTTPQRIRPQHIAAHRDTSQNNTAHFLAGRQPPFLMQPSPLASRSFSDTALLWLVGATLMPRSRARFLTITAFSKGTEIGEVVVGGNLASGGLSLENSSLGNFSSGFVCVCGRKVLPLPRGPQCKRDTLIHLLNCVKRTSAACGAAWPLGLCVNPLLSNVTQAMASDNQSCAFQPCTIKHNALLSQTKAQGHQYCARSSNQFSHVGHAVSQVSAHGQFTLTLRSVQSECLKPSETSHEKGCARVSIPVLLLHQQFSVATVRQAANAPQPSVMASVLSAPRNHEPNKSTHPSL